MTMPNLRDILNDTEADATDVEYNFNTIETHINTELISRDGSVEMNAPLILSDGLPAISAASLGLPIGMTVEWPVAAEPTQFPDWKLANGQILNVAQHQALYNLIGNTFNLPGDNFGGVQFRLPNYSQRVSVGADGSSNFAVGDQGGTAHQTVVSHTHTGTTQQDNHNHQQYIRKNMGYYVETITAGPRVSVPGMTIDWLPERTSTDYHSHGFTTDSTGNSGSGKNYPPYIAMYRLMKVN